MSSVLSVSALSVGDSSLVSSLSPVPKVNTIQTQTVSSPIWAVPNLCEGQLNMSDGCNSLLMSTSDIPAVAQVVTVPSIPMTSPEVQMSCVETAVGSCGTSSLHQQQCQHHLSPSLGHSVGNRMVVAKPLHPNQTLPPSIRTNLVSIATPSPVTSLAQLASHMPKLTPQMILAGLKSLQQQQHQQQQQQLLSQQVLAQQAIMQMLPSSIIPSSLALSSSSTANQLREAMVVGGACPRGKSSRAKPIMSKQRVLSNPSLPRNFLTQTVAPKIVAPIAMPPANTYNPHAFPVTLADPSPSSSTHSLPRQTITTNKPRKPCNCKNSQCLKLYCDCFANGEFCREACHCHSCKNNMDYAEDRAKAVKLCLDRNPHAFKPKVGQNKTGDKRRHIKGCNCKRSGCLKNYCECYEAKIPCSANCRCIGCKNVLEKPENKSLMQLADAADIRTQQQQAATSHFMEQLEITSSKPQTRTVNGTRLPFSFINKEVARATCLCLLEEASHASMNGKSLVNIERTVLEEFGRCMTQIINSTQSANEDGTTYVH